jgi:CRISPR-associated protein Csd2
MHRLVTDVAIKRKIRNMIPLIAGGTPALDIYVEFGVALSAQHERAYTELRLKLGDSIYKPPPTDQQKAQEWMWGDCNFNGSVALSVVTVRSLRRAGCGGAGG